MYGKIIDKERISQISKRNDGGTIEILFRHFHYLEVQTYCLSYCELHPPISNSIMVNIINYANNNNDK
jgi:hypothetical protein